MTEPVGIEDQQNPQPTNKLVLGPRTLELLEIESFDAIEVVNDWQRLGAETYVTDFFLQRGEERHHLIAKACIKFGPREAMGEWLERRAMLEQSRVNVPDLLVIDGATIVEEFIEHSFSEAFAQADDEGKAILRDSFLDLFSRVTGAGFNPTSLHDIRSRGNDSVVIDFGEDLGPSRMKTPSTLLRTLDAEHSFRKITGQ